MVVDSSAAAAAAVLAATTGLARGLNLVLLWGEKSLVLCVVAGAASTGISLLTSESTSGAVVAVTLGLDWGRLNLFNKFQKQLYLL